MTQETTQAAGRPRNAEASDALKREALRLVREQGYGVSIAAIIKAAGVSRQTLYNRWSTKAELLLDALFELADMQVAIPDLSQPGPRRAVLTTYMREVFHHVRKDADLLRIFISQAQSDPAFRAVLYDRFVEPRDLIVVDVLRDAQARGEIAQDRDPALISAMIHGAFWYRLLLDLPLDDDFAAALVEDAFRGAA
ncbi:TetR/AcrR family transcriptional regulator [Aliishimia ponticola]|uniref:TetR/AcrR family transcriptional regulator n=1 Tax=Aliishimia ponticola TaxID=2499833 RepID=A0A4S4NB11_9RHOB|nr:TetR/AcrR family transcriptional regulator [Aliishimia ponticola]THH35647.1 TetR/AcrR family transcriptional regulator [Aliishimia ponticola]